MRRFVAGFENNSAACAACYFLPLLLAPYFVMRLPVSIGAVVVTALFGMAAGRESRLRFHAVQAILLIVAAALMMGLVYWVMFGVDKDRFALGDGIAGIVVLTQMLIVWGLIILVFGFAYLYAAVKAGAGKDVCVPGVGNLAAWLARDLPGAVADVLKGFRGTLAQIARGEYRLKDHRPELGAMTVILALIAVLAFTVPGAFSPPPAQDPPQGIKATALTSTESFVGFPWGIDVEQTKKIAGEQGWRTGDHVSSMTGLSCLAVLEGYPARLQFFYISDKTNSHRLYQGFITMRAGDSPVETLYARLLEILTQKYGPTADKGYPPWRDPGAKPYGEGYGVGWEITGENGRKVKLFLALELEKPGHSSAPASPARLSVRYENVTLYDQILKDRWATN